MNYPDILTHSAKKFNSIVCMGLDPVLEEIPINKSSPGETIEIFYTEILNTLLQKKIYPGAVKPNYAFYAQYGLDGIQALLKIISLYKEQGFPVILDVKRGDIGKTARAYAREAFEFFLADAVTLSPYLGYDSIQPFVENYPEKGYYILAKTSNQSSSAIQDMETNHGPLYMAIGRKITEWYHPGISAVIGATYPNQLLDLFNIFSLSGRDIPLLIPGIGAQGGDLQNVMDILNKSENIHLHRINSSSGINYAYKKFPDISYSEAAVKALKQLNDEVNHFIE